MTQMMIQNLTELIHMVNVSIIPFEKRGDDGSINNLNDYKNQRKSDSIPNSISDLRRDIGTDYDENDFTTYNLLKNFQ